MTKVKHRREKTEKKRNEKQEPGRANIVNLGRMTNKDESAKQQRAQQSNKRRPHARRIIRHNLALLGHPPAVWNGALVGSSARYPRPTGLGQRSITARGADTALGHARGGAPIRRGGGARGGGDHVDVADVAVHLAVDGLDGLPGARVVLVAILLPRGVVGDGDGLDPHGEGPVLVVGQATGPVDGSLGVSRVAASPGSKLELHGCLGILVRLGGVGGLRADLGSVDEPDDAVLGPIYDVGVPVGLVVRSRVELSSIVTANYTLSEVVRLDLAGVDAEPFEVDFVEGVGLEDGGADDAGSGRRLHGDFDAAEHDVERRDKLWCITRPCDAEGDAVAIVSGGARGYEGVYFSLCEVYSDCHAEGSIRRACRCGKGVSGEERSMVGRRRGLLVNGLQSDHVWAKTVGGSVAASTAGRNLTILMVARQSPCVREYWVVVVTARKGRRKKLERESWRYQLVSAALCFVGDCGLWIVDWRIAGCGW